MKFLFVLMLLNVFFVVLAEFVDFNHYVQLLNSFAAGFSLSAFLAVKVFHVHASFKD